MQPFSKLLFFVLLTNLAQNLVHPVTPTLLTQMGFADYTFGTFFACMAVGMLVTSPGWGKIADRRGRRLVYSLGAFIYLAGQVLFFTCRSEPVIMAVRFLSGCGSSASLVSLTATAVDLTTDKNRAGKMSLFAAVTTLSSSLGYFSGGLLGSISLAHAFIMQFILLAINGLMGYFLLPAKEGAPRALHGESKGRPSLKGIFQVMTPALAMYLLCIVLANLGTTGQDNAFNYYVKRELDFPPSYNGTIKAVTGLLGLLATLGINRLLVKRFSMDKSLTCILFLCALALALATLSGQTLAFILFSMVFYLVNAMYIPFLQALMTRASHCDFGFLSGMYNAARSLGMVGGSLAAGFLYTLAPKAPFVMQILCFLLAGFAALVFSRMIRRMPGQPTA